MRGTEVARVVAMVAASPIITAMPVRLEPDYVLLNVADGVVLDEAAPCADSPGLVGIFLTHAHIGHYTGLMYLGRESMNSKDVKVYAMPRMKQMLEQNAPWSQLVGLKNISLQPLVDKSEVRLNDRLTIEPFLVPHRDEFSETVGYRIRSRSKTLIFIPDIDKWHLWGKNIVEEIKKVDIAFLDATFYDNTEVNNRNIAEIPHPFVVESLELFKNLPEKEKSKIHFLHFNHTNPLLDPESTQTKDLLIKGFKIAKMGDTFKL